MSDDLLSGYADRYFDAWGQRDISVALDVIADSITWHDPSLPEPLSSREGAQAFFEAAWVAFPDIKFEKVGPTLVDEASRTVVAQWVMRGTHTGDGFPAGASATGKAFEVAGCDAWHVDEAGRATSVTAYYDVAGFARQLGLA